MIAAGSRPRPARPSPAAVDDLEQVAGPVPAGRRPGCSPDAGRWLTQVGSGRVLPQPDPEERSVFLIFDDEFIPLLRPILFVILDLGFKPRIALKSILGRPRIEKILGMIQEMKYAIHDISRLKARKRGEYYRLNMPFDSASMSGAGCSRVVRRPAKSA